MTDTEIEEAVRAAFHAGGEYRQRRLVLDNWTYSVTGKEPDFEEWWFIYRYELAEREK